MVRTTNKKRCPQCKKRKPATEEFFSTNARGNISWCRRCDSARAVAWAKKNPERAKRNRRNHILRVRYGISVAIYEKMLKEQGGGCAICKRPPRGSGRLSILHVDHDHKTGKVRDLLCFDCNASIGRMSDDSKRLRAAAAYLDRHRRRSCV